VSLAELAGILAATMATSGSRLACAESCTGGLAAAAITGIPGSSEYFAGGVVAYSNEAKENMLGVSTQTIDQAGAVSEPTALAMASGAARAFGADFAFSITGVAGPGGGSEEKPVGTVWFGFYARGVVSAEVRRFAGDRAAVREAATAFALEKMADTARSTIALDNPRNAGVSFT